MWRKKAPVYGYDPNIWFGNLAIVALHEAGLEPGLLRFKHNACLPYFPKLPEFSKSKSANQRKIEAINHCELIIYVNHELKSNFEI